MINYTQTKLVNEFGEDRILTLAPEIVNGEETGEIDSAKISFFINTAKAIIQSYIRGKYPSFDPSINSIPQLDYAMGVIIFYNLQKTSVSEVASERFRFVIKYLEGIRDGKIYLTDEAGNIIHPSLN